MLYPVTVLGPGKRIAIWVAGCGRKCEGCANPELWEAGADKEIGLQDFSRAIDALTESVNGEVDGFTISGGEPFDQPEELLELVNHLCTISDDILIFTGYTKEELQAEQTASCILEKVAVLVDGPYIQEQNAGEILRGSRNQVITYRDAQVREKYEAYQKAYEGQHPVENFRVRDGVVSVGIHKKDFKEELEKKLREKQIKKLEKQCKKQTDELKETQLEKHRK